MRKVAMLFSCFFILIGGLTGCAPRAKVVEKFQKVESMETFEEYNGVRVEKGKFYFTAIEDVDLNVYAMDINTKEIKKVYEKIHRYESFIPLAGQGAVYVDLEGNLFYKKEEVEIKIDNNISGFERPNILVSPNRSGVLYTKGTNEDSSLYRFMFEEERPQLIVSNISKEAFKTFAFTTVWSNNRNYFVFNNNEVYNDRGEGIASIKATSLKWSPDDRYIAYIQMPKNPQENEVIIGDWNTYIGEKLVLYNIEDSKDKEIFESPYGLVDAIDSIQWSWNSENLGILEGRLIKEQKIYLERIEYEGVQVYHIPTQEIHRVEEMKSNYYQMLFTDNLYGKSLGRKSSLEVFSITKEDKKVYEEPKMLNSRDMFIISGEERGYLINGRELIELRATGEERSLINLPWDVNAMYLDEENHLLIIINKNQEMYLYNL